MDITTQYLGITLGSPLVPSASPLTGDLANLRRMEDAGAGAVVLPSLFEEQLTKERYALHHHLEFATYSYAEALTYFPEPEEFHLGPDAYLQHIQNAKTALDIPVIASLNGQSLGGWTDFAQQIEQVGADGLELNIYFIPSAPKMTGVEVEERYLDILRAVRSAVSIPVAVKMSPFFSNTAHIAAQFDAAGANALVLFNRFYQPDIDLENLEITPNVLLSTPHEMRLPLTWIGILYGRIHADLAATTGVHHTPDVLKMLMVGAKITMMCSTLFKNGIDHIATVTRELTDWLESHEYDSVRQMQGSMSQSHSPDPSAFERAQYMKAVKLPSTLNF